LELAHLLTAVYALRSASSSVHSWVGYSQYIQCR